MVPHCSTDSVMGSDGATLQCGTVSGVMVPHCSTDSVMGSDGATLQYGQCNGK